MLVFSSGNTRSVNARRAVQEALELAASAGHGTPGLVLLHAGFGHDLLRLSQELQRECPGIRVLGTSCAGVVGRDGPGESMHDIALMGIHGEGYSISHVAGLVGSSCLAKGRELALGLQAAAPHPVRMVVLVACGCDLANDSLIAGIESVLGPDVVIVGATSSDPMRGSATFQVIDDRLVQQAAFAVGLWDPSLSVASHASHGFVAIEAPLLVTRARENRIEELDGQPAWPLYLEWLGLPSDASLADTLAIGALAAPLSTTQAAEYGNDHILRAVTDQSPEGGLTCTTTCREGERLWLTLRDEERIFRELDHLVERIAAAHAGCAPLAVFHADCLARGRRLFHRVMKEELVHRMQQPFCVDGAVPPWLGMYGAGEFARLGGRNRFHNYTTALAVVYRQAHSEAR